MTSTESLAKKYKVLIVDDHPIVRWGLSELVAAEPDLEVCGEAESLPEALRQVDATEPDIVVVDLTIKDGHGLELVQKIKAGGKRVKMLVSSMHDESLFAERAIRAGASGYISKQEPPGTIIVALRHVLAGKVYLSSRMSDRLLHRMADGEKLEKSPIESLSNRELEVFGMIGAGRTTKQIAQALGLSGKTIETYRENIKSKMNLGNSVELSRHATQWVLEGGRLAQEP
jgi:DNA-binding NarL/FixJ family response regulator